MKIKTILFALSIFLFNSCSKNIALFQIDTTIDFVIPAGSNSFNVLGFENEVIFPYSIQLAGNGVSNEDIARVVSERALFYPRFDNAIDLDFINVIEINAINPNDPTQTKEVFHLDPVPFGQRNEIELFPSIPNVKDFIIGDRLFLQVEMQFRAPAPRNLDIRIDMVFNAIEDE